MVELRVLGGSDLRSDAGGCERVLTQSKILATLVFLVLATPQRFHRRDRIVGLLWPELDQDHARAALRKALHVLRRSLGEGVLVTRGDEEIAIAPGSLWCDATAFVEAIGDKRYARALELYGRGDLLPGLFLSEAGEFEDWLERERSALRDQAAAAAWGLASLHAEGADFTAAGRFARRAAELMPTDERMLRRVMRLLHSVGDRAGALHLYAVSARRLEREVGAPLSSETQRLAAEIRGATE